MRGKQTPAFSLVPKCKANYWQDVRDLCRAYSLILDPWQEHVLEAALGEHEDGRWAATRVGLTVPRQSGKTALFEARELAGLLLFDEQLIIHSAHLVATALEGFQRIKFYFENFDDLRRKVRRIREANGEQAIEMMSGQRLMFRARARGGGRGLSPDVLMMDEAQILPEQAWASMLPSMSARPNYQAWLAGTPPTPSDDSEAFTHLRKSAINGLDERLCWLEWSAERDCDVRDVNAWAAANPGLGIRIQLDTIADECNSMAPETFRRERLGVWTDDDATRVIPADVWNALKASGPPDGTAPTALAVDMSHERVLAISGCWRTGDDSAHVELVAMDQVRDPLEAVEWLAKSAGRRIPVVVDSASPAAAMVPALTQRRIKVIQSTAGDMGKACGLLFDDSMAGRLSHAGQPQLNQALAGAKKRAIRDAGAWGWDRKNPDVNLAPLVAATLARFGASMKKRGGGATFA